MKSILFLFSLIMMLSLTSFTQAQSFDTTQSDKVYMLDGSTMEGYVKTIKSDVVVFTEKSTQVDYELNKSDIKVIVLASGKSIVFNNVPNTKPVEQTRSAVVQQPSSAVLVPTIYPQFALGGLLLGSFENWGSLNTNESKLGFGISIDLLAGILLDPTFYAGIGPYVSGNFWSTSASSGSYTATGTIGVTDVGLDLGARMGDMYLILGGGSASVNFSASDNYGNSASYSYPSSVGYSRISLGWCDGWALGLSFTSYPDATNLNRGSIDIGWAF